MGLDGRVVVVGAAAALGLLAYVLLGQGKVRSVGGDGAGIAADGNLGDAKAGGVNGRVSGSEKKKKKAPAITLDIGDDGDEVDEPEIKVGVITPRVSGITKDVYADELLSDVSSVKELSVSGDNASMSGFSDCGEPPDKLHTEFAAELADKWIGEVVNDVSSGANGHSNSTSKNKSSWKRRERKKRKKQKQGDASGAAERPENANQENGSNSERSSNSERGRGRGGRGRGRGGRGRGRGGRGRGTRGGYRGSSKRGGKTRGASNNNSATTTNAN
mmetsp:Transcript_21853/g.47651  ORF Transcript_21853/g.47651 Transcript_21853/m.47651 type:complete len:274 (-) Transcript_21853:2490-3311(-)